MEAFLAKVAQAAKKPPSPVQSSNNTISAVQENGTSVTQNSRDQTQAVNGFSRGTASSSVHVPQPLAQRRAASETDFVREEYRNAGERRGGPIGYDRGPTVPLEDYLKVALRAAPEEIANLERLANSHGTVVEVRNKVARLLIQGFDGLVYLDEETFIDGQKQRGFRSSNFNVGDTFDVVTSSRSDTARFCTGVRLCSRGQPLCEDEYAIVTKVLDSHAVAVATNVISENVLLLNHSLPHDDVMLLLDEGNFIDWEHFCFVFPRLEEQPWLLTGRTVKISSVRMPIWLREQLQQFGPGAPCPKLAVRVEPYGRMIEGTGIVVKLLENGGVFHSQESDGRSKEVYFCRRLVTQEGSVSWEELQKVIQPGTRVSFVACEELPERCYLWRAIKLDIIEADESIRKASAKENAPERTQVREDKSVKKGNGASSKVEESRAKSAAACSSKEGGNGDESTESLKVDEKAKKDVKPVVEKGTVQNLDDLLFSDNPPLSAEAPQPSVTELLLDIEIPTSTQTTTDCPRSSIDELLSLAEEEQPSPQVIENVPSKVSPVPVEASRPKLTLEELMSMNLDCLGKK